MRIAEFNHFHHARSAIGDCASSLSSDAVFDVSDVASRLLGGRRVCIDATTHERFVEWSSSATRRVGIHLDQKDRLMRLLQACRYAGTDPTGSCFVCRAVDSQGVDEAERRHLFTLKNVGSLNKPAWLIHSESP